MKKAAFFRFGSDTFLSARCEVAVWVVGEDGDRYKIQTDNSLTLPGNSLPFEPGQTLYVRKYSVVMAGGE